MLKIGRIGIGHNHGEAKMKAVRKFPELFQVIGFSEDNLEMMIKAVPEGYIFKENEIDKRMDAYLEEHKL